MPNENTLKRAPRKMKPASGSAKRESAKRGKKPARKAQKGVPNPFRPGELMDVAAKPASIRVKALPLKKLKDMPLS
jgi:hypothetical protein